MTDSPLSANAPRANSTRIQAPSSEGFGTLEASRIELDGDGLDNQRTPQSTLEDEMGKSAPAITITIPAEAEYVLVVRLAVTGVASRMAFSFDQIEEIKLAVAEACNNAILHAAPTSSAPDALEVTVKVVPYPDRLEISVSDEGFVAPPGLPKPRTSKPAGTVDGLSLDLPEGGMGLLLMQTLMDEVSHHTGKADRTSVRMVKYLARR